MFYHSNWNRKPLDEAKIVRGNGVWCHRNRANLNRNENWIDKCTNWFFVWVSFFFVLRFAVALHFLHSHLCFLNHQINITTIWNYTGIGFNEFFFRKFVAPDWPIPNCVRSTACHKLMIKQYNTCICIHPPRRIHIIWRMQHAHMHFDIIHTAFIISHSALFNGLKWSCARARETEHKVRQSICNRKRRKHPTKTIYYDLCVCLCMRACVHMSTRARTSVVCLLNIISAECLNQTAMNGSREQREKSQHMKQSNKIILQGW